MSRAVRNTERKEKKTMWDTHRLERAEDWLGRGKKAGKRVFKAGQNTEKIRFTYFLERVLGGEMALRAAQQLGQAWL